MKYFVNKVENPAPETVLSVTATSSGGYMLETANYINFYPSGSKAGNELWQVVRLLFEQSEQVALTFVPEQGNRYHGRIVPTKEPVIWQAVGDRRFECHESEEPESFDLMEAVNQVLDVKKKK